MEVSGNKYNWFQKRFGYSKSTYLTGFSLIELLVSVAILVIVSGLVFFNQSGFNNSVLIENLAYEVSLIVRQAQSYGLQSKGTGLGAGVDFQTGYGVYLDMVQDNQIILYADKNKNKIYDSGDIVVDELKMTGGSVISKLCLSVNCVTGKDKLSISFIRPDPMAYINENVAGSNPIGEIYIKSKKNEVKKIVVNKIGQISIEEPI